MKPVHNMPLRTPKGPGQLGRVILSAERAEMKDILKMALNDSYKIPIDPFKFPAYARETFKTKVINFLLF